MTGVSFLYLSYNYMVDIVLYVRYMNSWTKEKNYFYRKRKTYWHFVHLIEHCVSGADDVCSSQVPSTQTTNHADSNEGKLSLAERRRSSLKAMRQCRSMPHATSGSTLRMLIESRVRLPTCAPSSRCRRRDAMSSDRGDFFLEIVRDVSCDLDLTSLTHKMLANLSALASADYASIYMVDTLGTDSQRSKLVVRSYDAREGLNDDERFSLTTEDTSTVTAATPWGQGLLGYVAETGVVVRLGGNASKTVINLFTILHGSTTYR